MKIAIFTNAYKPIISGVVNSIVLIREGLQKLGHEVHIFAPRFPDFIDKEEGVYRFRSFELTSKVKFPLAFPYSRRIFRQIDQLSPDIIHCHHPFLLGGVGANFAEKFQVPLVFTFHTQYEQYAHYVPLPQNLVKTITRSLVKKYAGRCDRIICPSPTILSLLEEYEIKTPIEMLQNAIDISQFQNPKIEKIREKYSLSPQDRLLIYVGRMGIEKNIEFMLNSFQAARAKVPQAKLMIVGEGPQLNPLKEYSRNLGLENSVIFPGRVEYSEIADYYGAAYAFIMTSTTEVKPLALLEAMASGLPAVAVAAAGSSDTVNEGFDGMLTDLDEGKFTQALVKILEDPALRDRLSEGARKTSEKYSMVNTARKLENLFLRMIEEKKEKANEA